MAVGRHDDRATHECAAADDGAASDNDSAVSGQQAVDLRRALRHDRRSEKHVVVELDIARRDDEAVDEIWLAVELDRRAVEGDRGAVEGDEAVEVGGLASVYCQ